MFTANLLSFSLKDSFPIDFTYHLLFTKVDVLYVIIPLNYNAGVARKYYLFIFIFLVVTKIHFLSNILWIDVIGTSFHETSNLPVVCISIKLGLNNVLDLNIKMKTHFNYCFIPCT